MEHHFKPSESKPPDTGGKIARAGGRPERAAAKRRALILAARHVFHEKGYADATIENIIDKAGGSRGTIYVHFSSKLSLLETVIREDADYVAGMIDEALSAAGSSGCYPDTLAKRLVMALSSERAIAVLRIVIAEQRNCPSIGAIYRSIVLPAEERIAQYFVGQHKQDAPAGKEATTPLSPTAFLAAARLMLLTGVVEEENREAWFGTATKRLIRMLSPQP